MKYNFPNSIFFLNYFTAELTLRKRMEITFFFISANKSKSININKSHSFYFTIFTNSRLKLIIDKHICQKSFLICRDVFYPKGLLCLFQIN